MWLVAATNAPRPTPMIALLLRLAQPQVCEMNELTKALQKGNERASNFKLFRFIRITGFAQPYQAFCVGRQQCALMQSSPHYASPQSAWCAQYRRSAIVHDRNRPTA